MSRQPPADGSAIEREPLHMVDSDVGTVGFIGLGTMGEPMAINLVRSGIRLVVWNRSLGKARILKDAGAEVADDVSGLFRRATTVVLMLSTGEAIDAVLGRGRAGFADLVSGHLIVNMGTPSLAYSQALDRDLRASGARYVEAPVSGQRGPAQAGQLVALLAGDRDDLEAIGPVLAPMCRETIVCGAVPQALATKVASNSFVGPMIACLAESVNLARDLGVDMSVFATLMNRGPMASDLLRTKLPKLVERDFTVQASLDTFLDAARLIEETATGKGTPVPFTSLARRLAEQAGGIVGGDRDVTAMIRALEDGASPRERDAPRG